jgi:hypothetical protein
VEQQAPGEPIRVLLAKQAQAARVRQSGSRNGLHLDGQQLLAGLDDEVHLAINTTTGKASSARCRSPAA